MLEVINKNNGKLIINDSPKVAIEIGADGFHLGMEDYLNSKNLKFIKEHKDMINSDYIKGLSCKWDCKLIKNPPEDLITWNYLGIGAFFKSETKENVSLLKDKDKSFPLAITSRPLVAIGGINYQNMDSVLSLGYETIAMSKGIFFKKDVENIIKNCRHPRATLFRCLKKLRSEKIIQVKKDTIDTRKSFISISSKYL